MLHDVYWRIFSGLVECAKWYAEQGTRGEIRLGAVSAMGQCNIRKLLIVGAMSVICRVVRCGGRSNRWLANLVARNPRMVGAVGLANKMARMV